MRKLQYLTGSLNVLNKYNSTDMSGETEGGGTFRFKLKEPLSFRDIDGKPRTFTHIEFEMGGWWTDTPAYVNRSKKQRLSVRPIPTRLWREMYDVLYKAESKNGQLDGWCFSDEIYDVAHGIKKRPGL